ncbi:MAG: ABC transporter ATP-binding protein [Synergistaceae bacterium]|nr:ABC transporter ATP-binding protein [Synergistaceae bacterium]
MAECVLKLDKVTIRFGGIVAVSDLSMDIPEGQIAGLIGPNGAGKTTVFNIITGFYKPTEGSVSFYGKPLAGKQPYDICATGIARTFQNIRLFSGGTVLENVMLGCHVREKEPWWKIIPPYVFPSALKEQKDIRAKSMELLEKVGLAAQAGELATSLPYGSQRRLEIARALATNPRFLLLDEPAAGMNPQESLELMEFIRKLRDEYKLTILLIEHDMKVVMGVCEHIWVIEYGILIADGTADYVRKHPKVIQAYLGEEGAA